MYSFTDSVLQSSLGLNPMNVVGKKDCRYSVAILLKLTVALADYEN